MGQNFSSIEFGNCRDPCTKGDSMFYSHKSQFLEKKNEFFSLRNFSFCTSKEHDNVRTPYYPFFAPLSVKYNLMVTYGRLKAK